MTRLTTTLFSTLFLALLSTSLFAEELVLHGYDAFQARQKTTCGTIEEGRTRYGIFEGRAYSRVAGEEDRVLFKVLGINVRHCSVVVDQIRGKGFRSVSREIMVYMDPTNGEVIDSWKNPWTEKEIAVMHVANDPVSMSAYRYERDAKGKPSEDWVAQRNGDVVVSSAEIPLFYKNPLGGEFQEYVGGTYHAMEIFNSFYDAEKLLNTEVKSIGQSNLGWSRVAKWLPWMEMGDRPGLMIFNASGFSTFDKQRIPKKMMTILQDRYPNYLTPPPLNDKRPNETSWTVFKKLLQESGEARKP